MNAKNITQNTIGVKKNHVIQSAVVEKLDEEYYQGDELEDFIDEQIKDYNTKKLKNSTSNDKEKAAHAITKQSFYANAEKASVVINYKTIEDYVDFNQAEAKILTCQEALKDSIVQALPSMISFADTKEVTTESAFGHDAAYVLIVKEPVKIKVEGSILYYANASKEDKNSVQTVGDKEAVIVYTLK